MPEQHPITPSPELIEEWIELSRPRKDRSPNPNVLATHAARWGADQELEACCEWVERKIAFGREWGAELRDARRLEPKSLKEQALEAAQRFYANGHDGCNEDEVKADFDIICRALESLTFGTGLGAPATERIRIDSSGNVGIGG